MAFEKHKKRVALIKQRISANKVFVIGASIVILFILAQAYRNRDLPEAADYRHPVEYEQELKQSSIEDLEMMQQEKPYWRFYWSDLIVLGVGSAFCGVMIIRERRKAREKL